MAVLGAGIQGSLAALELAEAGARVVLVDRAARAMTEASRWNEGKIHLGYIFANDPTARTARLMAAGAAVFAPVLRRWMGSGAIEAALSDPFDYAVMEGSLVGPEALATRYAAMDAEIAGALAEPGRDYLGARRIAPVRRLSRAETAGRLAEDGVAAVFRTAERSVDVAVVARAVREAVARHPRIETRWETEVTGVADAPGGRLAVETAGGPLGPFDRVVNALWEGRLA
ncbi:MAG: FAD-dependent oxidoreductase, partial [Pseudomonadota bacterium]